MISKKFALLLLFFSQYLFYESFGFLITKFLIKTHIEHEAY